MHSAHILKLLVAALSANTVTQGFIIDAAILGRNGVELAPTSETTSGGSSSATTTAEPVTSTAIVVVTATDGSVSSSTSVSVSTPTAGLSEANNSSGSSGMSSQTKNTIIGVVVGVGGAIVLAVGGLFAWRIWGRKRANEENDGLMSYNNGAEGKSEVGGLNAGSTQAGSARSPFQSTLESYHAPSNVNASSNF
ncbi:hypothetical protein SLS64_001212 [Diaporthe eres]|uniref:Mid2 domain-containing protein n=1 Tax=Diaporthe eres TaxID=83184 RepID=A0ABR1PQW4_DIAER